jgi:excinuclease ABC subunit A
MSIADVSAMPVREVLEWTRGLAPEQGEVSARILPELASRLAQIERLGAGYLTLDRATNTLSTGEAQRIRLAAELASNLQGVCYVLDEPTVGLHPRDTEAMIQALTDLRDRGNTVVVVEHEERLIRSADHVIDMGPGSGPNGGRVTAQGTVGEVSGCAESVTGRLLLQEPARKPPERRSLEDSGSLRIKRASLHNLLGVDVAIPLARLVCVTGVSGSGKSTLIRDVLRAGLEARLQGRHLPQVLGDLQGWEEVARVREVDESPIGRTPRSVPATYVGIMAPLRRIFARTPEARARGFTPARFSFNVPGGRCESCKGHGRHKVEMPLLPVVYLECEACGGGRYNQETLEARFKGMSIAEVLDLGVDQALEAFANFPQVAAPLEFLSAIGLGYLKLGQPSPTLSGGEAQRIKLAAEMARSTSKRSLFILDEPTTGLHMADVARLLGVLQQLVQRGDSVVAIEHDLDVAAAADWVIDMGPEGGSGGGRVVARGKPEEVAAAGASWTGRYLRSYLQGAGR